MVQGAKRHRTPKDMNYFKIFKFSFQSKWYLPRSGGLHIGRTKYD